MEFNSEVEVTKVENRTDKPAAEGESGLPGFYVKIKTEQPIDRFKGLYSTEESFERLLGSLYRDGGELATLDLDEQRLNTTGINLAVGIKSQFGNPLAFKGAELDGIKIKPMANRMAVFKARIKLNKPTDEQMALVLRMQHSAISLKVKGRTAVEEDDEAKSRQGDMLKGGEAPKTEKKKGKDAGAEEVDDRPTAH